LQTFGQRTPHWNGDARHCYEAMHERRLKANTEPRRQRPQSEDGSNYTSERPEEPPEDKEHVPYEHFLSSETHHDIHRQQMRRARNSELEAAIFKDLQRRLNEPQPDVDSSNLQRITELRPTPARRLPSDPSPAASASTRGRMGRPASNTGSMKRASSTGSIGEAKATGGSQGIGSGPGSGGSAMRRTSSTGMLNDTRRSIGSAMSDTRRSLVSSASGASAVPRGSPARGSPAAPRSPAGSRRSLSRASSLSELTSSRWR
jgi:hypothetical protein